MQAEVEGTLVAVIAPVIATSAITAITGEIAFCPSVIAISSYYLRSRAIIRAIIAITEGQNAISPVIAVIADFCIIGAITPTSEVSRQ